MVYLAAFKCACLHPRLLSLTQPTSLHPRPKSNVHQLSEVRVPVRGRALCRFPELDEATRHVAWYAGRVLDKINDVVESADEISRVRLLHLRNVFFDDGDALDVIIQLSTLCEAGTRSVSPLPRTVNRQRPARERGSLSCHRGKHAPSHRRAPRIRKCIDKLLPCVGRLKTAVEVRSSRFLLESVDATELSLLHQVCELAKTRRE